VISKLRQRLRGTPLHALVRLLRSGRERARWRLEQTSAWDARAERRQHEALERWRASPTAGAPPQLVKQAIVKEYARRHGLLTLVETGTLHGDMLQNTCSVFRRSISIELSPHLARRAQQRFARTPSVTVLQGDSEQVLRDVLADLAEPALFWLDAHYSADDTARGRTDTPIEAELTALLQHPVRGHVLLIDDARAFGKGDYPSIDTVRELVAGQRPELSVEVAADVIRIAPPP
jgi:hypothetical protein